MEADDEDDEENEEGEAREAAEPQRVGGSVFFFGWQVDLVGFLWSIFKGFWGGSLFLGAG